MGKTGDTKSKILKSLGSKNKTLTDLSRELDLVPSTVSKHLQDLVSMGAIEQVYNPYFRKLKYYTVRRGDGASAAYMGGNVERRTQYFIGGIVAILIVLAGAAFLVYGNGGSHGAGNASPMALGAASTAVPISLTDPPIVPAGTTVLLADYSSVGIHIAGNSNATGWIYSNTSGSVNLLSLINVSQEIATVNVPTNSVIDLVKFEINSAQIEVNGTTYNVIVPNGSISTVLPAKEAVNSSTGVLLDMTPSIVGIYTQNSTVFVMVPEVKAVLVYGSNANVGLGHRMHLDNGTKGRLATGTNEIQIVNASLVSGANDSSSISIKVRNSGNQSVTLGGVVISGRSRIDVEVPFGNRIGINASVMNDINGNFWGGANGAGGAGIKVHDNAPYQGEGQGPVEMRRFMGGAGLSVIANGTIGNNTIPSILPGGAFNASLGRGPGFNLSIGGNSSGPVGAGIGINGNANGPNPGGFGPGEKARVISNLEMVAGLQAVPFLVEANGTLQIPSNPMQVGSNEGYTLGPGETATLTFSGKVLEGPGVFDLSFVNGTTYAVVVMGRSNGGPVLAWVNATAVGMAS